MLYVVHRPTADNHKGIVQPPTCHNLSTIGHVHGTLNFIPNFVRFARQFTGLKWDANKNKMNMKYAYVLLHVCGFYSIFICVDFEHGIILIRLRLKLIQFPSKMVAHFLYERISRQSQYLLVPPPPVNWLPATWRFAVRMHDSGCQKCTGTRNHTNSRHVRHT